MFFLFGDIIFAKELKKKRKKEKNKRKNKSKKERKGRKKERKVTLCIRALTFLTIVRKRKLRG